LSMRTDPVFRNHPIPALAVICLSVFVISVDATIVNVALPTLSRELGADTAQLQWIVDAYTLVMSGLLLSVGSLSDRYGRRGWLSLGLALFAITSGVAAQVHSADALIAARAAMGVGAAVIFPTTLGLITNIFTDPVPRAKAIGLWAAMVGVGVAVGPISGGWLLEHFWWGAIFMVNIPIAVVAIALTLRVLPAGRRGRAEKHADARGHRDRRAPLPPARLARSSRAQRQVAEDEQQFHRQDRLHQRQRAEAQGADLEAEACEHAHEAQQPGWLPSQPEYQPGIEAAHLAALLKVPGTEPLAYGRGGGKKARGQGQQNGEFHQRAALLSRLARLPRPLARSTATSDTYQCSHNI